MKASENPFRSVEVAKLRYRIGAPELQSMAMRAIDADTACAILGPEGTGKTTLLEDLGEQLNRIGKSIVWHRLTNQSSNSERRAVVKRLIEARSDSIQLLDGGEVLGTRAWWLIRKATRRNLRLIATLHRNRGLSILHGTEPNWDVARDLVHKLHQTDDILATARGAFEASGGNVREVFRACYWACARK